MDSCLQVKLRMSIRSYPWEPSYATSDLRENGAPVDVLHDFYIPALQRATHYDRVAGYFTSSSLAAASQGFSRFVENGGYARFVVGMALQPEDAAAILHGDEQRAAKAMLDELNVTPQWPNATRQGVELLAWMVANGYLEIRVGLRVNARDGTPQDPDFAQDGYLHEKWAIIGDEYDELFISGSLNESRTALSINAENITLMPSWDDWHRSVFQQKKRNFEALWSGTHPHIKTLTLPEAVEARLVTIANNVPGLYEIDDTPALPPPEVNDTGHPVPGPADQLRFAMIRLAPLLPGETGWAWRPRQSNRGPTSVLLLAGSSRLTPGTRCCAMKWGWERRSRQAWPFVLSGSAERRAPFGYLLPRR